MSFVSEAVDGALEENSLTLLRAVVGDDVQVRNVEFFVDGRAVVLDGNFPYEAGLLAPVLTDTRTSFTLHAVVTDTGGNRTETPVQTLALVPDATPPVSTTRSPASSTQ